MRSFLTRWIAIIAFTAILLVGLIPSWQRELAGRNLIADQYRFGDLYNTTNLPRFKEANFRKTDRLDSADLPPAKKAGVHLYTIGDSFTDIDTTFYAAEKSVHIWTGTETKAIHLDSTKRNILVIEIIERVLQERFRDDSYLLYTTRAFVDSARPIPAAPPANWLDKLLGTRFGAELNNRLEFILFNNKYALKAKEWKADAMLDLFGRAAGGARLSPNKQHAFYSIEVDTTTQLSGFRHLTQTDIDSTVYYLNKVDSYYRAMGFDEIYLTLIPNKSTIMAPAMGAYNHQIERIERHPALRPVVISTIGTIRRNPDWYHRGDGHWNRCGRQYWLGLVNGLVMAPPNKQNPAGQGKRTGTL